MVDVIIQAYGKPWQTLSTLKSLQKHSGHLIDKIYFQEEAKHPFNDKVDWILDYFDNIVHYKPDKFVNIYGLHRDKVPKENVRHQWGIENSDKKYVFVTHNDVLYTGDIIQEMLNEIGDCVGIGEIGQCWNCPAKTLCGGGETWNDWNPIYEDITKLKLPHIRTRLADIDKDDPKLMPECRLNEFACLIDREVCIKENRPYFGEFNHDSGTEWFKTMYKKGYKFKDYRHRNYIHAYYANIGGHETEQHEKLYWEAEKNAQEYYINNLK